MDGPTLPSEWVAQLFRRFRSLYGNKCDVMWGTADADDLLATWAEDLGMFEGKWIGGALDACRLAYPEFPPTLPQFVRLCKDARDRENGHMPKLVESRRKEAMPAEIVAMIHNLTDPNRKRDCRDWARKILVEADKGEYTFPLGIQYAKEALGLTPERSI